MSKINWELEFDKFLLDNKAFDEFYMEGCHSGLWDKFAVSNMSHRTFIIGAFFWSETINGRTYWKRLNDKWLKRIKKLNKSPA